MARPSVPRLRPPFHRPEKLVGLKTGGKQKKLSRILLISSGFIYYLPTLVKALLVKNSHLANGFLEKEGIVITGYSYFMRIKETLAIK